MHGITTDDPGRYGAEIAVMTEMGWSWGDLLEAPADLVEEILERVRCREHWQTEKRRLEEQGRKGSHVR